MTCTQTQLLLDACADHALPAWQTVRARRHLSRCAACTTQLADIYRLNASVHAWRDVSAPAALEGRIAAVLPRTASIPTPPRDRRIARRAAMGLAGIAAAIGAGFWLLPGHPAQPTIAFADVERAMAQVQTVSWNDTMEFYGHAGHPFKPATNVASEWLRRSPPALASRESSQRKFQELRDSQGDFVKVAPGVYGFFPLKLSKKSAQPDIEAETEEKLQQFTQPQAAPPTPPANTSGQLTSRTRFLPTTQRRVTLDGQERVLFRRVEETTLTDSRGGKRHYLSSLSFWADPKTCRVVRTENRITQREDPEDWQVITQSDFHYNQPSPPGVFDWSPPPGAKVLSGMKAWDALFYFTRHPVH